MAITRDLQFYKFSMYGFLKNLRFFDPFLLLFFLEKGMSYSQIGMLYAIRHAGIQVLEIPSGVVADLLGRRRAMVGSFLSYIISFVLYFFGDGFWFLALATVLFAAGEAFRSGTHKAMILEYLQINGWEDQKSEYYGHTRSWSQMGSALSSLIAGALVFWRGSYAPVFLFTLIPYVLELGLMMSYPRALDGARTNERQKHGVGLRSLFDGMKAIAADIRTVVLQPGGARIMGNLALHSAVYKSFKDYLQPVLQNLALVLPVFLSLNETRRISLLSAGIYFVLYIFTSISSRHAGAFIERLGGEKKSLNIIMLAGCLLALLSGGFLGLSLAPAAVTVLILIMILENIRKPAVVGFTSSLGADEGMATLLSGVGQLESLFAALLGLILGFAADLLGLGGGLMLTGGLVLLAAGFLIIPWNFGD